MDVINYTGTTFENYTENITMKKYQLILILISILTTKLFAQPYEKAVITHLTYTIIPNYKENFDSISFP